MTAASRSPDRAVASLHGAEVALALYFRALCGRSCLLVPYDDDTDQWQHPDTATSLRLPSHIRLPPGVGAGDDWYRIAVTHRALHHELGTFQLDLARHEPLFRRMRPTLAAGEDSGNGGLHAFFGLFARSALAVEVFAALEDLRVDSAALRTMPGLRRSYDWVRAEALAQRPEPASLPARSAVAEALVRLSLDQKSMFLPLSVHRAVTLLAAIAAPLRGDAATVESSAEAAIRGYRVLARLPNLGVAPGAVRQVHLDPGPGCREDPELSLGAEELRLEGDEVFDVRFAPVRYRDVPGPRYTGQQASGMPLREAILRMTDAELGPALHGQANHDRSLAAESGQVDTTDASGPAPPPEPLPHDHGPSLDDQHQAARGAVHAGAQHEFAYPEWDRYASAYLPDWCLVRESRPRSGRGDRAYRQALSRHRSVLPALTAQLERMSPAGLRQVRRMTDGDDLDLDGCIEAMLDLRQGFVPSERMYCDSARTGRDVVVAFALDLSSSTAERLSVDPSRPMEVRRILDVEREAVVLLLEALERVGDAYGIYGFSGTGRQDVRLSVVKDIDEPRSPAVLRRLDGLRPHHTTRMGPVVRHLTHRLARHEAPTKVLVVISDGRPFDLDYGQQYGPDSVVDYALADTARALQEAREREVRPYLITVDPAGGDYLKELCDERDYHVIDNARDLPLALAALYLAARVPGRAGRVPGSQRGTRAV
jgi:hypothetical protein